MPSKFTTYGSISIFTISEKEEDGQVLVSIKYTGTGIDSELFPRLFSKFASKSSAGTGLGLYIAKSIIESHNGKICAENNSEGSEATLVSAYPIRGK